MPERENVSGKRGNCSQRAISPFPTVFSTLLRNIFAIFITLKIAVSKLSQFYALVIFANLSLFFSKYFPTLTTTDEKNYIFHTTAYDFILAECNLRPSALGPGWYDENVFGVWIQRPCAGGAAFNPSTCDCSLPL